MRVAENGRVYVGPDSADYHVRMFVLLNDPSFLTFIFFPICRSLETAADIVLRLRTLPQEETIGDPSKVELIDGSSGCSRLVLRSAFSTLPIQKTEFCSLSEVALLSQHHVRFCTLFSFVLITYHTCCLKPPML